MSRPGPITREESDDGFVYRQDGGAVEDTAQLERIAALAVPPAWTDVEIAAGARAKVQASGTDAAGRRQHIYSAAHRRRQERLKHDRALTLARALPRLRRRVDRDLRRPSLARDRVVAGIVWLIDNEAFRVGADAYRREHGSHGVTTLRTRHVRVRSRSVEFDFVGKGGLRQRRTVREARIARLLARLEQLPGAVLFESLEEGRRSQVRAQHVNAYIRQHSGIDASAKDLRTWAATRAAASLLLDTPPGDLEGETSRAAAVRAVVEEVAKRLGNTPAVARESYIDPRVLEAAERLEHLERVRRMRSRMRARRHRGIDEQAAIRLLE